MTTYAETLLKIKRGFLIIGLTGYTAAGCTTTSKILSANQKPILPNRRVIQDLGEEIEEKRFNKLGRVWGELEWNEFVRIEVSRVIFMYALARALGSTFKLGPLGKLREIAIPKRGSLIGLKHLFSSKSITREKEATELIDAYNQASKLYIKFKKSATNDLSEFIQLMQNYGDDIRKYGNVAPKIDEAKPSNILVLPEAIRRLIKAYRLFDEKHFVIDAFRNPYEVEFFKRRYNEFYLVAIHRDIQERNKALQGLPADKVEELRERENGKKVKEKTRDNIEEWVTSQNINGCFQKADYFINNIEDTSKTWALLRYHLIKLYSLVQSPGCIPPNRDERYMQLAMSMQQNSGCLSRHVGAVVVNSEGFVIGLGWNDSPKGQMPCALRTRYELVTSPDSKIYSKYERSHAFIEHIKNNDKKIPFCFKDEFSKLNGGEKKNEFTRALHAEENALMQATNDGLENVGGAALYTTDSPCTLCAKKAYQLGIKKIVYIQEYSQLDMEQTLLAGTSEISLEQFKGATSSAYFRLFDALMPEKDFLSLYI